MTEVAALEDVCERAWPPHERVALGGVVLRFADGFTRRANSARVDGGAEDRDALIAAAEQEYRSRGLRPGFRLTPLSPPVFEELLYERGYVVDTEAVVMVAETLPETVASRPGNGISLAPALDEEWLRVFRAVERRIDGEPAATGYARLEDDWLYIACVATFPERRRLGLGRSVSEQLFAWGAGSGARRAILQAETKNAAAQALYAQLGFRPRYVYRDVVPGR